MKIGTCYSSQKQNSRSFIYSGPSQVQWPQQELDSSLVLPLAHDDKHFEELYKSMVIYEHQRERLERVDWNRRNIGNKWREIVVRC